MDDLTRKTHEVIDEIRLDRTSGATTLTIRGAQLLQKWVDGNSTAPLQDFRIQLAHLCRALVHAQPSMAPILNLANCLLIGLDRVAQDQVPQHEVARNLTEQIQDIRNADSEISQQALAVFHRKSTVMTHSKSSTVLSVIRAAARAGICRKVVCTESRPHLEGIALAEDLSRDGIAVDLIGDAAAPCFAGRADLILVGADGIHRQGLINKLGTYGLGLAAHAADRPFYVLCGLHKFWPDSCGPAPVIEEKDPAEIWSGPEDIRPLNLYFDVTPLRYLTATITEKGLMSEPQVVQKMCRMPLHPSLLET
jgi:translation initiation factor 2B subunit (eIF-2B alpha/beta/delta family)